MNNTGEKLVLLLKEGKIPEEIVLLYGMSGEIINKDDYYNMTIKERESYWEEKFKNNLGDNWRKIFRNLPYFLSKKEKITDWAITGF